MALFPPEYLDTVVAIGERGNGGPLAFVATGFLYGHAVQVDERDYKTLYQVFLVTNRHVAQGEGQLVARLNGEVPSMPKTFSLPALESDGGDVWTVHPGDSDVAVMKVSATLLSSQQLRYRAFQKGDNTISRQDAVDLGVGEGSGVFVLGFPMGIVSDNQNFVIVRSGILARVQDWLQEGADDFLIDALVFPGSSGSPVITTPEPIAITDTQRLAVSRLIGMVVSYIPYNDVAVSPQTGDPRVVFTENSGLARVIPVDAIEETVELAMARRAPGITTLGRALQISGREDASRE